MVEAMLTDAQKKLRAERYGSSEVAAICGIGPGKAIDVYLSKVHPEVEREENLLMELGSLLEQPVASVYGRRTGTFLATCDSLSNPKYPLAICTPDRARFTTEEALKAVAVNGPISTIEALEGADRLVEVKTTGRGHRHEYGREGSGSVPEEKALQATWQLGLTEKSICDMPVLFRGDWNVTLEVFTVALNADLFAWAYDEVSRFHTNHVLKHVPPPPDGTDRYDEALARMFPADRKPPAVADEVDEQLMLDYAKFREVARRAELLKKKAGQRLKARIGDAGGLISTTLGKLSWTRSKDSTEIDWQQAANEFQTLSGLCLNAFDTLSATGEQITPENRAKLVERMKAIIPAATKTKAGYRSLRLYPKGAAELELARLNVAMDALEEGASK